MLLSQGISPLELDISGNASGNFQSYDILNPNLNRKWGQKLAVELIFIKICNTGLVRLMSQVVFVLLVLSFAGAISLHSIFVIGTLSLSSFTFFHANTMVL